MAPDRNIKDIVQATIQEPRRVYHPRHTSLQNINLFFLRTTVSVRKCVWHHETAKPHQGADSTFRPQDQLPCHQIQPRQASFFGRRHKLKLSFNILATPTLHPPVIPVSLAKRRLQREGWLRRLYRFLGIFHSVCPFSSPELLHAQSQPNLADMTLAQQSKPSLTSINVSPSKEAETTPEHASS